MKNIFVLISCVFVFSCTSMKKMAMGPTGALIYDASFELQTEKDWESFERSLLGNIKLLEGFLSQAPENKNLQVALLKAYVAKAFGVNETEFLKDLFLEVENSKAKKKTLIAYTKALRVGLKFLETSGLPSDVLETNLNTPDKLISLLEDNISNSKRDLEGVLFTAQALGALINLQRESMKTVAYLPVAKSMFDWVCKKDSKINFGTCDIFYASYDSGRPRMLGGDPEKGKNRFLSAIKDYPNNYLIRQSYVQYYIIPMLDDAGYREQKLFFSNADEEFFKDVIWKGGQIKKESSLLNVFNMIAIRRMNIIKSLESEIF